VSYYLSPQFVLPAMACLVALEYVVLAALVIRDEIKLSRWMRRHTGHVEQYPRPRGVAGGATYTMPNGSRINTK